MQQIILQDVIEKEWHNVLHFIITCTFNMYEINLKLTGHFESTTMCVKLCYVSFHNIGFYGEGLSHIACNDQSITKSHVEFKIHSFSTAISAEHGPLSRTLS